MPRRLAVLAAVFTMVAAIAILAGSGCGNLPWNRSSDTDGPGRPVVVREAFDPRERATHADPLLIRLDDLLAQATVSDDPSPAAATSGLAWDFDSEAEGWTLIDGAAPELTSGRLTWTSESGRPGIVSPPLDLALRNLGAIEIRMRASAGQRLRVSWTETDDSAPPEEPGLLRDLVRGVRVWWSGDTRFDTERSFTSGISAGGDLRRYVMQLPVPCNGPDARIGRLRFDPTDGARARIEIESIRLTGPVGVYEGRGHGLTRARLGCESRNAIFHRAPSEISWEIDLPDGARFESGVGLLEARAGARISVNVEVDGRVERLLETKILDDEAWHDLEADLSRWGGRRVRVVLAAGSESPGQVVLWSNPMIVAAIAEGSVGEPGQTSPPPTNVILYVIDSLRADHLSSYGYGNSTSPHLDAVAAEGVLFERCAAPAPSTLPSVASLMTSLAPPSHGATDHGLTVTDGVITIQEFFRRAGYVTAGFAASPHSGSSANLQQGYDWLVERLYSEHGGGAALSGGPPAGAPPDGSALLNDEVLPWLDRHGDRPFYLFIHSMDPHAPYAPPPGCASRFATGYSGPIDGGFDVETSFRRARSKKEIEHVMSLYDAEIACNDEQIGRLVDHLREIGILDETLLVFTSDHGEEFREHGAWEHGKNLNREAIDVPLVMRLPGRIPRGARIGTRVSGLDVMPTILDLVGLTAGTRERGARLGDVHAVGLDDERATVSDDGRPAGLHDGRDMQGVSLAGLFRETAAKENQADTETSGQPARPVVSWRLGERGRDQVAIERWPYKLILFGRGDTRLYDLSSDPGEQRNLDHKLPGIVGELSDLAREWLDTLPQITTPPGSAGTLVDAPPSD